MYIVVRNIAYRVGTAKATASDFHAGESLSANFAYLI